MTDFRQNGKAGCGFFRVTNTEQRGTSGSVCLSPYLVPWTCPLLMSRTGMPALGGRADKASTARLCKPASHWRSSKRRPVRFHVPPSLQHCLPQRARTVGPLFYELCQAHAHAAYAAALPVWSYEYGPVCCVLRAAGCQWTVSSTSARQVKGAAVPAAERTPIAGAAAGRHPRKVRPIPPLVCYHNMFVRPGVNPASKEAWDDTRQSWARLTVEEQESFKQLAAADVLDGPRGPRAAKPLADSYTLVAASDELQRPFQGCQEKLFQWKEAPSVKFDLSLVPLGADWPIAAPELEDELVACSGTGGAGDCSIKAAAEDWDAAHEGFVALDPTEPVPQRQPPRKSCADMGTCPNSWSAGGHLRYRAAKARPFLPCSCCYVSGRQQGICAVTVQHCADCAVGRCSSLHARMLLHAACDCQ